MNEKMNSEACMRLREEALARRMGEALDRLSVSGPGECPDAEVIAAYHERALQPDEIAHWESHFSGCSRCRKILAVLAASVDAPLAEKEVERLGELVAAATHLPGVVTHGKQKLVRLDRFDWRARWLAPALGVAAVLAVWFALRPPWRTTGPGTSETIVAQAPKNEPQLGAALRSSNQLSRVEPSKAPELDAAVPKDRPPAKTVPASPAPNPAATNRTADSKALDKLKAGVALDAATLKSEKKSRSESTISASGAAARAPLMPPTPSAEAQLQAANGETGASPSTTGAIANSPPREKQALRGRVGEGVKSAAQPASEMAKGERYDQALSPALDAANVGDIPIQSPSGKIQWHVGKGGRIQRSADAGRTWALQASPSQQDWIAGAATSDTVCWLVGRSGSIARTTDGEHWMRLASPQPAGSSAKFPDWIGVTATSAQVATITSSDHQRYMTQDGGQTWRLQ